MTFGFPAHFADSRPSQLQHEELVCLVRAALDELGWRYEFASRSEVRASTSSLKVLGEILRIEILPDGVVMVESKCGLPSQCLDWGKNKRNVQRFIAQLEQAERTYLLVEKPKPQPLSFDDEGLSPVGRMLSKPGDD
jgi:hypothetical protein